jgi:hypothetical protein
MPETAACAAATSDRAHNGASSIRRDVAPLHCGKLRTRITNRYAQEVRRSHARSVCFEKYNPDRRELNKLWNHLRTTTDSGQVDYFAIRANCGNEAFFIEGTSMNLIKCKSGMLCLHICGHECAPAGLEQNRVVSTQVHCRSSSFRSPRRTPKKLSGPSLLCPFWRPNRYGRCVKRRRVRPSSRMWRRRTCITCARSPTLGSVPCRSARPLGGRLRTSL